MNKLKELISLCDGLAADMVSRIKIDSSNWIRHLNQSGSQSPADFSFRQIESIDHFCGCSFQLPIFIFYFPVKLCLRQIIVLRRCYNALCHTYEGCKNGLHHYIRTSMNHGACPYSCPRIFIRSHRHFLRNNTYPFRHSQTYRIFLQRSLQIGFPIWSCLRYTYGHIENHNAGSPGQSDEFSLYSSRYIFFADGLFKIQISFDSRKFGIGKWWLILTAAIVTGILGCILVLRPSESSIVLTILIGISLLAEGLLNLSTVMAAVKIINNQYPDDFDEYWSNDRKK